MTRNDRAIRVLLTLIVLLLGANLIVNMNNSAGPRTAYAEGIPDSGAQLQKLIDAVNDLNKKVDRIDTVLESGTLNVKVQDKSEK